MSSDASRDIMSILKKIYTEYSHNFKERFSRILYYGMKKKDIEYFRIEYLDIGTTNLAF